MVNVLNLFTPFTPQTAKINARISKPECVIGEYFQLELDILSGNIEQHISSIKTQVDCYLEDANPTTKTEKTTITSYQLEKNIVLSPNTKISQSYDLFLPLDSPITMPGCRFEVSTSICHANEAVYQDRISIYAQPNKLLAAWFSCLAKLNLKQSNYWIADRHNRTHFNFAYQQKYRYINMGSSELPNKFFIIFSYESYPDYLDINIDLQKSNYRSSQESFRITITNQNNHDLREILIKQIKEFTN